MKITRENYEAWFIDHIEGRLTPEQEKELNAFLVLHPELQEELDMFEPVTLEEDGAKFENKSGLKKIITAENKEELLIGYVEGILSAPEKQLVEQNTDVRIAAELDLYKKTKLQAEAISFPNKSSLYRRERTIIRPLYYRLAAAAGLLLAVGIFFYPGNEAGRGLARVDKQHGSLPVLALKENQEPLNIQPVKVDTKKAWTPRPSQVTSPVTPTLASYMTPRTQGLTTPLFSGEVMIRPALDPDKGNALNYNPDPELKDPSLAEFLTYKVKDQIYRNNEDERVPGKIRWFEVVNVLGKGLAAVTGKSFKMNKTVDDDGHLLAYRIDYGNYTIEKDLKP